MKKCNTCLKTKPLTDFRKNSRRPDGLQTICGKCSADRNKQWYKANKGKKLAYKKENQKQLRDFYRDLKRREKCKRCGENDPRCLDYHHRDPTTKKFELSEAAHRGFGRESILLEMKKCDVLCSNCHRKITFLK